MSVTVKALEAEALHLSPAERARLIERLIESLDADPEVEEAWATEIERRQVEIESGTVSLLPDPEISAKLKAGVLTREMFMATTVEQLVEQAMKLPSESRARLADLLVESLEGEDLGRIERLWTTEAKRRRDEVRTGKVETIPGEEALRQVRDSVRR